MNLPGFIFGLVFTLSGAAGLVIWLRLSGVLKPAPDGLALGFEEGGASVVTTSPLSERIEYGNLFEAGPTVGHRMTSLLGIVAFILSAGALLALALYQVGHQATKLIEHFIQTSPSP